MKATYGYDTKLSLKAIRCRRCYHDLMMGMKSSLNGFNRWNGAGFEIQNGLFLKEDFAKLLKKDYILTIREGFIFTEGYKRGRLSSFSRKPISSFTDILEANIKKNPIIFIKSGEVMKKTKWWWNR
jgi:hypothetical protein